ncbi:MAG: hypothetical protein H7Y07_03430 [Pyrinomonadaceae bacterium]|nr:hypothetical protein [Sphingobacteriaceae bacterium]
MKTPLIISLALLLFSACGNNTKKTTLSTDSLSDATISGNQLQNVCFQLLEGTSNQDTSFINLKIADTIVNGIYNRLPYQKDSRKGTIQGTLTGNIIKANWVFSQEGTTDTLDVEFKLSDGKLLQKTFGVNPLTGREQLVDTSTFSITYQKVECKN